MRRILFVVIAAALASPLIAVAAEAQGAEGPTPAQACQAERTAIGAQPFKDLHGTNANKSNAFGKCVAKKARIRASSHAAAVSTCRAEQEDPNFAASHDGKTFAQHYGTGNGRNAFGKCVSSKARSMNQASDRATTTAAKQCKTERAGDPAAFRAKYGTNAKKTNAFGKCVAQKAKAQGQ